MRFIFSVAFLLFWITANTVCQAQDDDNPLSKAKWEEYLELKKDEIENVFKHKIPVDEKVSDLDKRLEELNNYDFDAWADRMEKVGDKALKTAFDLAKPEKKPWKVGKDEANAIDVASKFADTYTEPYRVLNETDQVQTELDKILPRQDRFDSRVKGLLEEIETAEAVLDAFEEIEQEERDEMFFSFFSRMLGGAQECRISNASEIWGKATPVADSCKKSCGCMNTFGEAITPTADASRAPYCELWCPGSTVPENPLP